MKQSKLEAYRLYFLVLCTWNLVIRFNGNELKIEEELRRIYEDAKLIQHLPSSCPTLVYMQKQISGNRWVKKIQDEL